jgi:hydroxyacylglutathione hydrolase
MLMRMVYDDKLAQASYLIGCQRTGEAIVIDPERDVDRYVDLARREGVRIVAAAETHIHADFLSGARELSEHVGAKVYVSGQGGPDWTYQWLDRKPGGGSYPHQALRDGDVFRVGNVEFRVLHTPGHTPEHVCFLVTDRGGGATEPMGLLTGDFVFVGDLGRPDLLETAAGEAGAKEPAARQLFRSLPKFAALPDYVQVWPAHGAGSACGKALGAVPQSTVGYEKRFNPAIRAATSEAAFVDYILTGQPEPPLYFSRMKRDNRAGPKVLGTLPRPRRLTPGELVGLDTRRAALVDTRGWRAFLEGHVPGSLFCPLVSSFTTDAGSLIREDEPIHLIVDAGRLEEALRDLARIGLDRVEGWIEPPALEGYVVAGGRLVPAQEVDVSEGRRRAERGEAFLLDVRRASEFAEGRIPGAVNIAHTRLAAHLERVPRDRPVLVNCRSGGRSARAVAFLERAAYRATNLAGGFVAWEESGAPVER